MKKLKLSGETVRVLTGRQLIIVHGGIGTESTPCTESRCASNYKYCNSNENYCSTTI